MCVAGSDLTVRWNISITTGLSFAQHPVAIRQQVKHWLTFYILNCIQGNWYILWFCIIPSQSENLTHVETHFPKKHKNWFKYSIDIAEDDLFTKSLSKRYWPSQPEDICCIQRVNLPRRNETTLSRRDRMCSYWEWSIVLNVRRLLLGFISVFVIMTRGSMATRGGGHFKLRHDF